MTYSDRQIPSTPSTNFFFLSYRHHRDLHSFPTRRSSDLHARVAYNRWGCARGSRGTKALARVFAGQVSRAKDRKSTRLNSSHVAISYAVFCLKKKKKAE